MRRIYLAGAITGTPESFYRGWREHVLERLAGEYDILNPLDQAQYDGSNGPTIIQNDERMVASADLLLVMGDKPSWGTGMEIQLAYMLHIPVYVVIPGYLEDLNISPWLVNRAFSFFNNLDQVIDYLIAWKP